MPAREKSNLEFNVFDNVFLNDLKESTQKKYITKYLQDLGAKTTISEVYFDRDYLSEISSYYYQCTDHYDNACKRIHIFSTQKSKELFEKAISNNEDALKELQEAYLGYTIIRPIKNAPFGKTILAWYKESKEKRVVTQREYTADICGLTLRINGLAWQQQDQGVSACATVALWSMLQSSALDDYYYIPTTSEITEAAHKTASLGSKIYPSEGLTMYQVCESIKEIRLTPCLLTGDLHKINNDNYFSKERFLNLCGSFIRSGYPVLIGGMLYDFSTEEHQGHHAICMVGFKNEQNQTELNSSYESIKYLYINDDNIGLNVRFKVETCPDNKHVMLKPSKPDKIPGEDVIQSYPVFIPHSILATVQPELRTNPFKLYERGTEILIRLRSILQNTNMNPEDIHFSLRFIRKVDYFKKELNHVFMNQYDLLKKIRLELMNKIPNMSKHITLVRFGTSKAPWFDILFDTSDAHLRTMATITYFNKLEVIIAIIEKELNKDFNPIIKAF